MPRTKEPVREPLSQLKKLESDYAGTPMEQRLHMLKMLKENQKRPLSDVAAALGVSERNAQRWWGTYRREGLEALLQHKQVGGRRPRRLDDQAMAALQEKLESDGIGSVEEARAWLEEQFGVRYSRSGVWYLMRNSLGATPRGWETFHDDDMTASPIRSMMSPASPPGTVPEHVLRFLNSLPVSGGRQDVILQLRSALLGLLGDVDKITFVVNFACNLTAPQSYQPQSGITQYTDSGYVAVSTSDSGPLDRILETLRQQGHPFEEFHPPIGFAYNYAQAAYLGAIILWRSTKSAPISPETTQLMDGLRPFLEFVLSDMVARDRVDRPIGAVFNSAIAGMVRDAGLSSQEERVALLQLLGHSYREIADRLYVTVDTVKKHFKQIYRKTKTRSQSELFAKYFTTRITLSDSHVEEEAD